MKKTFLAELTATFLLLAMVGMANAVIIDLDSTYSNTVTLELDAGFYNVTPVSGTYDSWNAWGYTSNCDENGICTNGWINNYSLSSSEFTAYLVTDGIRYSTASLALQNAIPTSFTLLANGYVDFFISDSPYTDNIGGMTLNVEKGTAPVPEPATILLLGGGLAGLAFYRRKRK